MIDTIQVDSTNFEIRGVEGTAKRLLFDAVDDIADEVEKLARRAAPGSLSQTGVGRSTEYLDTRAFAFGGGHSVRGGNLANTGQFSKRPAGVTGNHIVIHLFVPINNEKAIWVHEGTGLFGPHRTRVVPRENTHMVFVSQGKKWFLKSTAGQQAQPYLRDAFNLVQGSYEQIRVAQLRAQIAAST